MKMRLVTCWFTSVIAALVIGLQPFAHGQTIELGHGLTPVYGNPIAPPLELPGLDGKQYRLSDYRGSVVLINFWATWCPPCVQELPDIAALQRRYRDRADVQILPVSCGRGIVEDLDELASSTRVLLQVGGIDMPTYADPEQTSRRAFDEVGRFEGYPTTLILDRDGVIRGVWVGIAAPQELEALMTELLDQ